MPVIVETIVVTVDRVGSLNVAPQGLVFDDDVPGRPRGVLFRPYRDTTTFRNLEATRAAVVHLTDDALLVARSAIGLPVEPRLVPATRVRGQRIEDAPLAYEVEVVEVDASTERASVRGRVVAAVAGPPWRGFNRARHAVLEAAILATRVHLTGPAPVLADYAKLWTIVEKTGGEPEREAMRLLEAHVRAAGARAERGEP
jgi:uncharacterized protein